MPIYQLHLFYLLVLVLKLSSSTAIKDEEHVEAGVSRTWYSNCGNVNRTYCFGAPLGCIEKKTCDYLFYYDIDEYEIHFGIIAKTNPLEHGVYTAAALSTSNKTMSKSLLTICSVNPDYNMTVSYGYINKAGGNITDEIPIDPFFQVHYRTDEHYHCFLTYVKRTYTYDGETYSILNTPYYLAILTGTYDGNRTLQAKDDKPTILIPFQFPTTTTTTTTTTTSHGSSKSHEITTASYVSTSTKGHGSSISLQSFYILPFLVSAIASLQRELH